MKNYIKLAAVFFIAQLSGCYSGGSQSALIGAPYNKAENITTYMKIPIGEIRLPGEWKQGKSDYESKSQDLWRNDSVLITVSITGENQYSIYNDSIKGKRFPKAHFEWDSKYMRDTLHAKVSLLKIDTASGTLMWEAELKKVKNIFLLYDKNERFYHIQYIFRKDKGEEFGISLLNEIYALNNKQQQ